MVLLQHPQPSYHVGESSRVVLLLLWDPVCYNTVGRRPGVFQIRRGVTSPIGVHLSFVRIFCRSRGDEAVLPRCWRVGPSSDKRGLSLSSTANLVLLERQKALKSIEIQANRVDKTILMKNVFL